MSPSRRFLLLGLIVILSGTALILARWQWGRHMARRDTNAWLRSALDLPATDLTVAHVVDSQLTGRRVVARGRFLPEQEIVLRGRAHRDAPGVHVATPFQVDSSGAMIWVLRGFALAADAFTPSGPVARPVPGTVQVTGVVYALPETDNGGQPVAGRDGDTTWQRLDRAMALSRLPGALDGYLLLDGGTVGPGKLPAAEPPALDAGPHLSYTIQWIGIAVAMAAFGVIALRRRDPSRAPPVSAP